MIEIVRGSNLPILLDLYIESDVIQVALYNDNNYSRLVRKWDSEDVFIKEGFLVIPLSESDTLSFPVGIGHLEIKYISNNIVKFVDSTSILVKSGQNLTALIEEEINYENMSIEELLKICNVDNEAQQDIEPISAEQIDEWFGEEDWEDIEAISPEQIDEWFKED